MKNKVKIIICLVAAVILCLCFVACSAPDRGDVDNGASAPDMGESNESIVNDDVNRKIVYTVRMSLETDDVSALKNTINQKSEELGGYVESNNESYDDGKCTSAYITYRVPTENLDAFISDIEGNGGVESKTVSTTDITTTYVDAVAKKESLLERKQLLEAMLEDASVSASDRINVINEISEVNTELQATELLISGYDSQVGYSTVVVNITEKTEFGDVILAFAIVAAILLVPVAVAIIFLIIVALIVKSIIKSVKKKNA